MGIERIALEHHGDVAVARLQARHVAAADQHPPGSRRLETGKDPERRGLAATRRSEERQEGTVRHVEIEGTQSHHRVEPLLHTS